VAMKHPACAAGRCEMTVLGLETTEAPADAQSTGGGSPVIAFLFLWPFRGEKETASDVRGQMCLNKIGFRRSHNGKILKLNPFSPTPNTRCIREELAASALASERHGP
jgi:hypothetical protein